MGLLTCLHPRFGSCDDSLAVHGFYDVEYRYFPVLNWVQFVIYFYLASNTYSLHSQNSTASVGSCSSDMLPGLSVWALLVPRMNDPVLILSKVYNKLLLRSYKVD